MDSRVKSEIRKLRRSHFPRWVIIGDSTKPADQRMFWNGQCSVGTLREAMLFADKDSVLDELVAIHRGRLRFALSKGHSLTLSTASS